MRNSFYGNSGYVGKSKSVRAAEAEANGLVVKSKLNKSDLIDTAINDEYNLEFINKLKVYPAKAYKEYFKTIDSNEWHHTGKYYNQTNYYSYSSILSNIENDEFKTLDRINNELAINKTKNSSISKADRIVNDLLSNTEFVFLTHTEFTKINKYKWNTEEFNYFAIKYKNYIYDENGKKFKSDANCNKYYNVNINNNKELKKYINDLRAKNKVIAKLYKNLVELKTKDKKEVKIVK